MKRLLVASAALTLLLPQPAHAQETEKEQVWKEYQGRHAVSLPPLLRRIGGCESSGRPNGPLNYTAQNRRSSASGAFQITRSTWASWARAYGRDVGATRYAAAKHAPPRVQDIVATRAFRAQGTRPWRSSRACWGRS